MRRGDDEDPGKLADKLEHDADRLERRSGELGDEVDRVRQDWQRKRADEGVPGAPPDDATGAVPDDTGASAPSEEQTQSEESDEQTHSEESDEQAQPEEPG